MNQEYSGDSGARLHGVFKEIDRIWSEFFGPVPAPPEFPVQGESNRFLVARMGSTGSTWLAKLLNSHPDVYCSHELILAQLYPRTEYGEPEVGQFLRYFAGDTHHEAYRAIGDVGSVWTLHLPFLSFPTALLVRHPARVLNTRQKMLSRDGSFVLPDAPWVRRSILELWGVDPGSRPLEDQIFLHDAFTYLIQLQGGSRASYIIRIEDMADPTYVHTALTGLTGIEYPQEMVADSLRKRVNQRNAQVPVDEIVRGFTAAQRAWYFTMIRDAAAALHYDLSAEAVRCSTPIRPESSKSAARG